MFTPWGYEVEELPPIMDAEDYLAKFGGVHASDAGLAAALDAASAAVRNVCGWHVAPSLECVANVTAEGRLVRLPARLVTAISEVSENGAALSTGAYEAHTNGLLRRCEFANWASGWQAVHVEYSAGFDVDACPDLADVLARIVDAALTVPAGVASETAGNVSISYSAAQGALAASSALAYAPLLGVYMLVGAHAA